MDGYRDNTTGEADLTLTNKEVVAMQVAIIYTLHLFDDDGCQDTRQCLYSMKHTLEQLGVML